ncbi:MAG: twin-arginine translocase TatA/TatE family subunit [Actinomycetota bacterium]|nr:twin-arginine translocase TatA/TatE family subunit [Actinomycetota bacterium]
MFGLGIPELMVIGVIALIIFGPKRLPEIGKSVGQALREFKKGAESVAKEVKSTVDVDGLTKDMNEIGKDITQAGKSIVEPLTAVEEPKKETEVAEKAPEPAQKA